MLRTSYMALALAAFLLPMGARAAEEESGDEETYDWPDSTPSRLARMLADEVLNGGDAGAIAATGEALAWAGLPVRGGAGVQARPAIPPEVPIPMFPSNVKGLAREASRRADGGYAIALDELGAQLQRLGWKFPRGKDPGQMLVRVIAAYLSVAGEEPERQTAFPAFFLQAMSEATDGPDLATGDAAPSDVRLSWLELNLLFTQAFRPEGDPELIPPSATMRRMFPDGVPPELEDAMKQLLPAPVDPEPTPKPGRKRGRLGPGPMLRGIASVFLPATAEAATGSENPCTDFVDETGLVGKGIQAATQHAAGSVLDEILGALGIGGTGNIEKALSVFNTLWITDGDGVTFTIHPVPTSAHYAHAPDKLVQVSATATVKIRDVFDGKADTRKEADCLATMAGLPMVETRKAIAETVKDWKVTWDLGGASPHARMARIGPGNELVGHTGLITGMKPAGLGGTSSLRLDMATEKDEVVRAPSTVERRGVVRVAARVDPSKPPDPKIFLSAATGNVADPLFELLTELYKKLRQRKASTTFVATWHEKARDGWAGTIQFSMTVDSPKKLEGPRHETEMHSTLKTQIQVVSGEPRADASGTATLVIKTHSWGEETISCWKAPSIPGPSAKARTDVWDEELAEASTGAISTVPVSVRVEDDGDYEIATSTPAMRGKMKLTSRTKASGGCPGMQSDENSEAVMKGYQVDGLGLEIEGHVNPGEPDTLAGSAEIRGGTATWSLRRVR